MQAFASRFMCYGKWEQAKFHMSCGSVAIYQEIDFDMMSSLNGLRENINFLSEHFIAFTISCGVTQSQRF